MERLSSAYRGLKASLEERGRHYLLAKDILETDLTTQAILAMTGPQELKEKAETILRAHNLMEERLPDNATLGSQNQCILAKQLGGQIFMESILGMSYLSPTERLVLVEFMERFDRGEYPEFVRQEDLGSQRSHASIHGHQVNTKLD